MQVVDNTSSEGSPPASLGVVTDLKEQLAHVQQQLKELQLSHETMEIEYAESKADWDMPVITKVTKALMTEGLITLRH